MTRPDSQHSRLVLVLLLSYQLTVTLSVTGCGEPGVPSHGRISNRTERVVEYQCDAGYQVAGGQTRRQCHHTAGHWTGAVPLCSKF